MVSACARTFNRPEYILLSILSTDLLLEINGRKTSLRQFFWDRNTLTPETDMDRKAAAIDGTDRRTDGKTSSSSFIRTKIKTCRTQKLPFKQH